MVSSEYVFVKENSTHKIYFCPHCLERRGKPDKVGKLYIDKRLSLGLCFKCGFIFRDPDFQFMNAFSESVEIKKVKTLPLDLSYLKKLGDYKKSPQYEYMISRGFSDEEVSLYEFRILTMWGLDCVLIPNKIISKNRTDYYQIKFINGGNLKYYNLNNYEKPLTNISGIKNKPKLIICEGFFTSHSASRLPECDSVAILGKTLTSLQSKQLSQLSKNYNEIIIGLDEDVPLSQKEELAIAIRKIYDGVISCIFIPNKGGKRDFNDMEYTELENLYENRLEVNEETFNYIKMGFLKI